MPKFPAGTEQEDALPSCFSSDNDKKVFLPRSAWAMSFTCFCFLWVTVLFKMSSKQSVEGPSIRLLSQTAATCLTNTYACQRSSAQAWVTRLLAVNLLLVTQRYIFNTVSLQRNIHKTRLCTDWLNEMTRGSEELNPECPLGTMVQ